MATADPSDESSTSGAGPDNASTEAARTGAAAEASTDPDDSNSDADPAGAGDTALDDAEQDDVDAADAVADELDEMVDDEQNDELEAVAAEEDGVVVADGAADPAGSDDDAADPDDTSDVGAEGQVSPGVDLDSPVGDVESNGAAAADPADGSAGSAYGSPPAEEAPAESEPDAQTASEPQSEPAPTDAAVGSDGGQPATTARSAATALRQQSTPDAATTVVDTDDASVDPAPQTATTGLAGLVSKFLGLLGIGPSAGDTGVPLPTFEFVTAVFGAIRREMDRLFSNDGPNAAPVLTGQAGPGVLTGSLGATDPEGDPLRYSVVQAPGQGAVTVDADGDFVYTAGPDLAAAGGTDTFVIRVRDTGFRLLSAGPRTTEVPVTVTVSAAEAGGGETSAAAAPTAMLLAAAQATSTGSGSVYQVSASGPDIVGFDPAKDKLDLGDVSVHNFIVVDTAEGVGFRNPWSGETAIVQGVSLGQLTVDSFTPIINDHLRQDLSGALAWEHGVTAAPGTVYARSHEVGQIDRVAFDAATDVVDFRYYGTREQLYMTDTPEGVVISNAGTGQALILQGVTTSQLTATNFVFHNAQVREDRLHLQLGIGTVPNSQVLPQGVPIAGTDNWPTAAGNGAPPSGQTGTTTTIAWQYGTHTTLDFDPAADTLDFGWFKAHEFAVDEVSGSTRIAIVNNNQSYTLTGVGLGELQMSNIVALDDTARAKWQTLISNAAPPVSSPTVSVGDASASEGDSDSTTLTFTVTLSEPAGQPVTVSYSTANGTATAAGADYTPTVGTLTFAAGETVKTVNVAVTGDTMIELDEQFTLNLSAPVNAVIGDGVGVATIVNDDVDTAPSTPPAVSIADLTVAEGDGEHSHFMFTVTLDKASDETVTVQYSTSDGTAIAGVDYTATTGTVTFAPGVTTQLVHVDVIGDAAAEPNETFTVTLSSPVGATLADGSAIGTITDDDTVTTMPGLNSGNPGDELWGEAFYAPYVDMGLWPVPDLVAIAQSRGASLVTLGFLQATPDGKLAWAGLSALAPDSDFEQAQAINSSIAALQAAGGDVMISFGGASGTSLAQWYATRGLSARSLADAYVAVAQTYSLHRIDFDIEGAAVADAASIALRSQALALLQQDLPDLEVWYTLPVLPTGLTADGLNVVRSAVDAGVTLDGVNVMAMDYGESAAPTSGPNAKTMGAYAIQAAESTYAQLSALYGEFGQSFGWNQVGVTPMIGVNDVTTEVFTVADAQALEEFARAKGLGMLSMWSVARDTPGSLGQASPTASGLDLPAGSFSAVFNDYGTANDVGDALPTLSISDASVVEGDGGQTHVMFTVTLSAASDEAVSVGYVTSNGTATAGVDYTAGSGVVTFAPGVTSQMVHVTVTGDTAVEGNETFTVSLSNPSGATIADGSAVGTITNDDVAPTPTPGASSVTYVVSDDWGSGFVAGVKVTAGSAFDGWTVEFDTPAQISNIWNAEIVSHVGQHYVVRNASWNAKVAAGQSVEFGFQAAPGGGSSAVTGFKVNGSSTGGPAPVVPKVSVADASVVEGNSGTTQLTFTVTLDAASDEAVSVGYVTSNGTATAGVDYTAADGTITFAPGVLSQQISVTVTGDTAVEGNETFTVSLSNPSGATIADGSAVGTITNDDVAPTPTPGASSVTYVVSDDWGSGFVAGVKVTAGSAFDGWTVEFDTPAQISNIWNAEIVSHVGQHYVVRNASWNAKVAAGQSVEFGFQAAPGGGSSAVTGFVVNGSSTGGPAPVVPKVSVADASVVEGNSGTTQLTFTVTLDAASDEAVSVGYVTSNGTATAGVDYTAADGTITFAPGVLSQQISVTVTGDGTAETDETFTLTLSSPSGVTVADGSATGTIVNDDVINPANLMLSISDASVVEGAPGSGVAPGWFSTSGNQIVDSAGNPVQIAGINWFGMESDIFTPHGLWTRNYQDMMDQMVALEFNTIRLPYSSEMLHTTKMPSGIDFYRNPELAGLTPIEIMDEVIRYAGEVGLRVILDHHRSSAGAGATANGLWYEGQYTEAQWIADWQMLAARYADDPTVIGADLHNEPHNGTWGGGGATDWAAAAERAGNAILAVNDNWLIFVEGVASYEGQHYWWGGNLMGVADRPIVLDVADRVVYSPHDYPNSVYAQPWFQGADFGDALPDKFEQMWGYIYEQNIAPIYLGEFGTRLSDPKDVVWYEAITSYLSGDFDNDGTIDIAAGTEDMSWTFWSWNPNSTDTGGILADDWNTVNANKLVYLEALQFDFDEGTSGVLANFVVTLAQPSNQTVTVQYATSNGTATGGDDYVAATGTLTFAPGETSKTISVVVLGDTVAEGTESFLVTLSSPTGATVGDGTGTGTITDATVV
ncbi:Calx-beta domain-containing protein [Mycolicibacterium parafortuitum]|uniref:Cellulase family glycosylhydrolase n=1 Tax=Mycolicibacterium parafortuitum TaxID=39692 RepID=A0ACC6MD90_MYCPF|nr:Calx-beta domain-containing protein [Mycolicibacterium parafortuitum]MDZ5084897.1 cellulase family glycosylhydrolase [Mycolicibacterium parafortuitum]